MNIIDTKKYQNDSTDDHYYNSNIYDIFSRNTTYNEGFVHTNLLHTYGS